MAYVDVYIKIIGIIITRRIVRYAAAFLVLGPQFMLGFVNINRNVGNSRSIDDIRIVFLQIACGRNHKLPVHLIQINLCVLANGTCGAELGHCLSVLFAVSQLFLNLLGSGAFTGFRGKPVGELIRTVIAQVPTGKFLAFCQTHLFPADGALPLFHYAVKKSHSDLLVIKNYVYGNIIL